MTSVVRIKRRASQEPNEALLLATKRVKFDNDGTSSVEHDGGKTNVFKFCGSSENEKENVDTILKLVEKGKLMSHRRPLKTCHRFTPQSKKPIDYKEKDSEKKYKVLNTLRNISHTHNDLKIYDLVLENEISHLEPDVPTCNGVPLVVEKHQAAKTEPEENYVYDFYYSDQGTFDDSYIDQLMSVRPHQIEFEEYEGSDDDSDDSENSNRENHIGNEYPDSSEGDSDCDADIVGRMCGMYLDREDELSSEDEDFIYSTDDDPRQGDAYLRYKQRVIKELDGSDSSIGSSDELECYD